MFGGSLGFGWCGNTTSFGPNSSGTIIIFAVDTAFKNIYFLLHLSIYHSILKDTIIVFRHLCICIHTFFISRFLLSYYLHG